MYSLPLKNYRNGVRRIFDNNFLTYGNSDKKMCSSTHLEIGKTGIEGLDTNRDKAWNKPGRLPSWLEHCAALSQEEYNALYNHFPKVVDMISNFPPLTTMPTTRSRVIKLMESVVPWQPHAAIQFSIANKFYMKRQKIQVNTEEERLKLSLAWSVEMVNRSYYINDDFMDEMEVRNNLPVWHTIPEIGLHALNDSRLMNNAGILVMDKLLKEKEYYNGLVDLIQDFNFYVVVSESKLNLIKPSLNPTGLHSYESMVNGKIFLNGLIFPNLPIAVAMLVNGCNDKDLLDLVYKLGAQLAQYASIIDDCTDISTDEKIIERETPTDISMGKNSFLIWKALEIGNETQRQRLMEIYGKREMEYVREVKEIYQTLNVRKILHEWAEEVAIDLEKKLVQVEHDVPHPLFTDVIQHFRGIAKGCHARM